MSLTRLVLKYAAPVPQLCEYDTYLFVGPHPDDIEIGAGAPKIIVPIVGVTKDDIIAEAKTFDSIPVDMVEWRVDWYEDIFDFAKTEATMQALREVIGEMPILFTFRTSKEGGEKADF